MIIDDEIEFYSAGRTVINFDNINMPSIIRLGKVNHTSSHAPLTEHSHLDSFELVFFFSGEQTYYSESKSYRIKPGEFFISIPNELHGSMRENEEKSNFYYLIFHLTPDEQSFLGLTKESSDYILQTFYSINERVYQFNDDVKGYLNSILSEYLKDHPMKHDYIKSLFIQLFYSLTNSINSNTPKKPSVNKLLDTAISLIEQNPQKFFSTEELSSVVYMSNSHFKSSFKKYTGFTPYDYVLRNKITLAEDMLSYTHMSITDISFELGFASSQHFSSIFKKYTLLTPSQFRKQHFDKKQ